MMQEFRSATRPGVVYTVRTTEWADECDCPGFAYRRRCRHVDAVVEARYAVPAGDPARADSGMERHSATATPGRPPDTRDGDTHEVLD